MSGEGSAPAIREWAAQRRLPEAHLKRWLARSEADRAALLGLAGELHLRTGQMVAILDLLDEITVREAVSFEAILARDEIRRAIRGVGSSPERAQNLIAKLRALRFPTLARTQSRLEAMIAAMRLPPSVTIVLPRELASDELKIQLGVRSPEELAEALAALSANAAEIKRIIGVLSGDDQLPD